MLKQQLWGVVCVIMVLVGCTGTSAVVPSPTTASTEVPTPTSTATLTPVPTPTAIPTPPTPVPDNLKLMPETEELREGWWKDAVFYELFVRSFYDSDGDGVGDLEGVIEKLDYLNDGDPATDEDLGVTALWLMPIMESPSYHGYDVVDYMQVEQDYGNNAAFLRLMEAAHARGIRVIVDLVMNHTSDQHPWFVDSSSGDDAEKRDWYIWADRHPQFVGPWGDTAWHRRSRKYFYGIFWSGMPDLNYYTPEVSEEMYEVARFWLEDMQVDGFRLDAARYLVEEDIFSTEDHALTTTESNLGWLENFRDFYTDLNPEAMTVGEVWTSSAEVARYMEVGALDLAFDFDLAGAIVKSVSRGNPSELRLSASQLLEFYPQGDFGTFLTNHDQDRVMVPLMGDVGKAKLAAATYLTLPGVPFLYYGEEIGMQGEKPDEWIRTPMQWSAEANGGFTDGTPWQPLQDDFETVNVEAQDDAPDSLLSHYRRMIRLRQAHPALRGGTYRQVDSSDRRVIGYLRVQEDDRLLVVMNYSSEAREDLELTLSRGPLSAGTYVLRDLLTDVSFSSVTVTDNGGFAEPLRFAALEAQQILVLALE